MAEHDQSRKRACVDLLRPNGPHDKNRNGSAPCRRQPSRGAPGIRVPALTRLTPSRKLRNREGCATVCVPPRQRAIELPGRRDPKD
jgi:hypothetical protein